MTNESRNANSQEGTPMKPTPAWNAVRRARAASVTALAAACILAQGAMAQPALPIGGTVNQGVATISSAGPTMTVNQATARAVIDWASFNIGNGASVAFTQPDTTSVAVNRVGAGGGQSVIDGALSANGHVMILNADGVAFTSNAVVNVGGLIASTGHIDVAAFMSGPGAPIAIAGATAGSVANEGSITATDAGLVAFVAPSVVNRGTIAAASGRIALAGAQTATVSLNGGLYELAVDQAATNGSVANSGSLLAPGGSIVLSAEDASSLVSGVVNLSGIVQATHIEVRGNRVVLASDLDAPTVNGNSSTIEVQPGAQIQDAIAIAKAGSPGAGATVDVQAGTYAEQVTVNRANLALSGEAGAKIVVPDGASVNGITISASNATVSGFEIAGPVTSSYLTYPWGSNISRGIVVAKGADGFTVANNNIHDIRTGILIDGRDSAGTGAVTGSVIGNVIENTKSGISVQYTDGSGITVAGNSQGPVGNEWGVNLHLNQFLDGGTLYSNPHVAAPSLTWQQSLLDLSAANGGWSVQDQGYSSSNRTQVQVATTGLPGNQGSPLKPLASIASGISAVVSGGTVNVAPGTYTQTSTLNVNKSVTLAGAGETQTTIDARGVTGYGVSVSADHVTLSDFTVYGPSAYFASAYGIKVSPGGSPSSRLHDFTIRNVTSRGAGKAELDLNGVDGATIDHVTADGAPVGDGGGSTPGAGIQLTDSANVTVTDSTTRNNAWGGIAIYQANRSYDQQANNITVAANNQLTETNPLYLQDESTTKDFGALNLPGFSYAVRNAATSGSAQYTWMQAGVQGAVDLAVNLADPTSSTVQGWSGTALTQDFHVGVGNLTGGGERAMSIQAAIDTAAAGGTVTVGPGNYTEIAANRSLGIPGTYTLGLLMNKDGLTIRGVDANGSAITSADGVQAWVTAGASTNFGMNHGVIADNVTIEGIGFKPYAPAPNKTIEIAGDNFTFRNSVVDNRTATGGAGALYFGELIDGRDIARLTVQGSTFLDGSVSVQNGVGVALDDVSYQPAADRQITGNSFIGSVNYRFGGLLLTGQMAEVPWRPHPIGAVVATGNSFGGFDESVMVRGEQQGVDLGQVMQTNVFDRAVLVTGAGGDVRAGQYLSLNNVTRDKYSIQSSIQAGVDRAAAGDTVTIGAGTYPEQISVSKSVALIGAGADQTVIAPSALAPVTYTSPNGSIAMRNILTIEGGEATNVEVSGVTLRGPVPGITSGIFVRGGAYAWIHDNRLIDMRESQALSGNQSGLGIFVGRAYAGTSGRALIESNEITGYQKGGIVVDGPGSQATITGNTIAGEGPTAVIAQNGIQVSRGASATLAANTVSGNVYTGSHADPDDFAAGVLVFTSGPYVGQGVVAVASSNTVTGNEFGIWTNDASTLATIDLTGTQGNARNAVAYTAGGYAGAGDFLEYPAWSASTTARVEAAAFGASQPGDILDVGGTRLVSGWSGFAAIQPAIDAVPNGGTVNVGAGTYAENVTINGLRNLSFGGSTLNGLTLGAGAAGSGIGGSVNANTSTGISLNAPVVLLSDTTLGANGGAVSTAAIDGTKAGAQALTVNSGSGAVSLGDLGATTPLGATEVTGTISLAGASYSSNSLQLNGPITLTQAATNLTTNGGSIVFGGSVNGTAAGAQALTINAGSSAVTLGDVGTGTRLGATEVTGTITLAGSAYNANSLQLSGPMTLTQAATNLTANGGSIAFGGPVNGTVAGAQALTIDAGGGAVTLADLGAGIRLGATDVTGTIAFAGSNYHADSLQFTGPMTLTQAATDLVTNGGSVVFGGPVNGTVAGAQALTIDTGSGAVTLGALGSTKSLGATAITGSAVDLNAPLLASSLSGGSGVVNVNAGARIQDGIAISASGATVNVSAETFAENVTVNSPRNLSFGGSTLNGLTLGAGASGSGIGGSVNANTSTGISLNAPVVLLSDTTLATSGGAVSTGAIDGTAAGGQALTIDAGGGAVTLGDLGAATRLGATDVTGTISLVGASYSSNSLQLNGPITLTQAATNLTTNGGSIVFGGSVNGTVAGTQALTVNAGGGAVTLGALGASTSLGATVITGSAVDLNAPLLASNLSGGSGVVNVNAGARIQDGIAISASGATVNVSAGTFAENMTVNSPRNLSFGGSTLNGLTLGAGAAGSGIGGSVSAAGISLNAPVVLRSDTTLATNGGAVSTAAIDGSVAGAQALTIDAGGGAVTLGALGASTSLGATVINGHTVDLSAPLLASSLGGGSGVVNVQAGARIQDGIAISASGGTVNVSAGTYAENVTVNSPRNLSFGGSTLNGLTLGAGAAGSGIGGSVSANSLAGISLNAPVVLRSDTTLGTNGGAVSTAAIDGSVAGAQALTVNAGSGAVTLGDLGAGTRLGATGVTGTIAFAGSSYNADSLQFTGPMTLTQASTTLTTGGGGIVLSGDIQAATGGSRALLLHAGPDGARGDVRRDDALGRDARQPPWSVRCRGKRLYAVRDALGRGLPH